MRIIKVEEFLGDRETYYAPIEVLELGLRLNHLLRGKGLYYIGQLVSNSTKGIKSRDKRVIRKKLKAIRKDLTLGTRVVSTSGTILPVNILQSIFGMSVKMGAAYVLGWERKNNLLKAMKEVFGKSFVSRNIYRGGDHELEIRFPSRGPSQERLMRLLHDRKQLNEIYRAGQ